MAPFLSFTAEEAWSTLGKSESIFLETFTDLGAAQPALMNKWRTVQQVRELANKEIEHKRSEGLVGASLQAELLIHCDGASYDALASLGEDLKFVFITSKVALRKGEGLVVEVKASEATKCERCWHYCDDIGHDPAHPTVCGRCVRNLAGIEENRRFV
jgi:isoleucyl-tRNA synthetase